MGGRVCVGVNSVLSDLCCVCVFLLLDEIALFCSEKVACDSRCQTGRDGWVAGCSGGAGVFGIVKDLDYKTSYQFAWPSLLQAGFPLEHSCALSLPCIKQTAAG